MTHDSDIVLPDGWTRSAEFEDEHISDYSKDFTHPSIQGQRICYPFPIMTHAASLNLDLYSSILPFHAQNCTMILGSPLGNSSGYISGSRPCLTVELYDNAGLRTGIIEPLFVSQNEYERGDPCELIAISMGSARKSYRGMNRLSRQFKLFEEIDTFPSGAHFS